MGLTILELEVGNPANPEVTEKVEFLIDSGATYSVVPAAILERLGIRPISQQEFRLADGSKIVRKKGVALFRRGEQVGGADVIFGEEGDSTLLGTLTLAALGFVLDPLRRELRPLPMLLGTALHSPRQRARGAHRNRHLTNKGQRTTDVFMPKLTIREIDLKGKRVFIRVDFNVPLNDKSEITNDTRIRACLPTFQYALERGARLILASHLGRPKGKPNPKMSLKPAATRLSELLRKPVAFASDCVGPEAEKAAAALQDGEVLLLENLRFHPEEEKNDPEFSKRLAGLAEVYVNDAFGSAHRAHASTAGITQYLKPAVAGLLMEKELEYLGKAVGNPEHPYTAIIGGAKVSDKIELLEALMKYADSVLIGGAMAYTFLKAQGVEVGRSLVEDDKLDLARQLLQFAERRSIKLLLPVDHVVAEKVDASAAAEVVNSREIPADRMGVDIGPRTRSDYAREIAGAKTIVWNGPMGVFEIDQFAQGTRAIASAVADSSATSIVGGGDSLAAIAKAGVESKITHISTGGGATLEFLSGLTLPGVAALTDK